MYREYTLSIAYDLANSRHTSVRLLSLVYTAGDVFGLTEFSTRLLLLSTLSTPTHLRDVIFTALCTLVQSAVLPSHVVCLSVRL